MVLLLLLACSDPCDAEGALASCLQPTHDADYYAAQSSLYFDTMDSSTDLEPPSYSDQAARWEWPPWLKLTAFANIEQVDQALVLLPSTVPERDCRGFSEQPFGRCRVTFFYEAHEGRGCPIYEEFFFNDAGEMTWIEAWSDLPGYRPVTDADPWAEREDAPRLGARIPGLGSPEGKVDLQGEAMVEAAEADPDVADFLTRALDWQDTWLEEVENSGGEAMWEEGCGW